MGKYGLGNTMRKCKQDFIFLNPARNSVGKTLLLLQFYILSFVTIIVETISSKHTELKLLNSRHTDYKQNISLFAQVTHRHTSSAPAAAACGFPRDDGDHRGVRE